MCLGLDVACGKSTRRQPFFIWIDDGRRHWIRNKQGVDSGEPHPESQAAVISAGGDCGPCLLPLLQWNTTAFFQGCREDLLKQHVLMAPPKAYAQPLTSTSFVRVSKSQDLWKGTAERVLGEEITNYV